MNLLYNAHFLLRQWLVLYTPALLTALYSAVYIISVIVRAVKQSKRYTYNIINFD